jgi:regulatory protein
VEDLLDDLERVGHLSADRFVESLVRRRSARYGLRRVEQELGQHRISAELQAPAIAQLRRSDAENAWLAWQRRFGQAPSDLAERARQHRFLAARGFTGDSVAAVFKRLRSVDFDDESAQASPGDWPTDT